MAIANGLIARLDPDIAASDAVEVIDARGRILTAGLIEFMPTSVARCCRRTAYRPA